MAWFDKDEVTLMVGRIMEKWERHYDDMLNADAKSEGWHVAYESPCRGGDFHRMRLVQVKGDDPQDVPEAQSFIVLHPLHVQHIVSEMRASGRWELGREWQVPVESRLGALMWLNRLDPATAHELPDPTAEVWHGPLAETKRGDYGLTLQIMLVNRLASRVAPRRRALAQMRVLAA